MSPAKATPRRTRQQPSKGALVSVDADADDVELEHADQKLRNTKGEHLASSMVYATCTTHCCSQMKDMFLKSQAGSMAER